MAVISASPWRFTIMMACFLGANWFFFPMLLLIVAFAAAFGPLSGSVCSSAGLLASATLNYAIGPWLGREVLLNALGPTTRHHTVCAYAAGPD